MKIQHLLPALILSMAASAQDRDNDGASDSFEEATGFDPGNPASTPPPFRSIGVNFANDSDDISEGTWEASLATGYVPQARWNHIRATSQPVTADQIISPVPEKIVTAAGQETSVTVTGTHLFSDTTDLLGNTAAKLFNGFLLTRGSTNVNMRFANIPYPDYDVLAYLATDNVGVISRLTLNPGTPSEDVREVLPSVEFSGSHGFQLEQRNPEGLARPANVVRFKNLSANEFTLFMDAASGAGGLAAVQIIDRSQDSDGDQLPDWWENRYRTNSALANASNDLDGDGLDHLGEFQRGSDPTSTDTDGDGLSDLVESGTGTLISLMDSGSDPTFGDTDGDGRGDYEELYSINPSDPNRSDTDGDGVDDGLESEARLSAQDAEISTLPLPQISTDQEFRWETRNVQIIWNHTLTSNRSGHPLIRIGIQNPASPGFRENSIDHQLSFELLPDNGVLDYRIRSLEVGAFRQSNGRSFFLRGDDDGPIQDLTARCGFSGLGSRDISDRLTFLMTAQRQGDLTWNFTVSIINQDTGATVMSRSLTNLGAAPSVNNGTAAWRNQREQDDFPFVIHASHIDYLVSLTRIEDLPTYAEQKDDNNDGVPDAWTTTYNITDVSADPDGDGVSNYDEYLNSTDPNRKDSDGDGIDDNVELGAFSDANHPGSTPFFFRTAAPSGGDLNGNGLADLWERQHSRNGVLSAEDDPDGDGFTNRQESLAGTDPFDAQSFISLLLEPMGDSFRLTWQTPRYKSSRLASSEHLSSFTPMPGATSGVEVTIDQDRRFFSVEISDLDQDGDGLTDFEEAILGTNPQAAHSTGRPIPQDLDENGEPENTLSGDYATFLQLYGGPDPDQATSDTLTPYQASRFLMQTTFGPRAHEIEELRRMGLEAWIEDQMNQPMTSHEQIITRFFDDLQGPQTLTGLYIRNRAAPNFDLPRGPNVSSAFARAAIQGPDQLRQRLTLALSQIFVISQQNNLLQERTRELAHYYDLLASHAFGNYYDLLEAVTRNPSMGIYLSSLGNLPPDPSINRFPDENYAREVMQLFTIGLHEMNLDGSLKRDASGDLIQNYNPLDITEIARVFTGLNREDSGGSKFDGSNLRPMRMFARNHDFGEKILLGTFTLPASEATDENAENELRQTLRFLFDHGNTPPFVSQALIRFLVTDNPSPGYIERVARVFIDDGEGERGNLAAVWKAILFDQEARDLRRVLAREESGRLRDPLIRMMHLARLLRMDKHRELYWWEPREQITEATGQMPLNAISVFNFYKPDYKPPGPLLDRDLIGGPFEILDNMTAVAMPNLIWETINDGFQRRWGGDGYSLLPFYDEFLPYADDHEALLDHLNLVACAGRMTAQTRAHLITALDSQRFQQPGRTSEKIALALYGTFISPECAIAR